MTSFRTITGDPSGPASPEVGEADPAADTPDAAPPDTRAQGALHGLRGRWAYLIVALISYVPMLATKPGVVSDDTKTYLYLDPWKWIKTSASIWDPTVALGSVTHETIGYVFPMGPYYWLMSVTSVPTWVAQRLWLGSLVFAAAAGVLYLSDTLELKGWGRLVAALAYGFTPYIMQYAGRISVILMPFAGLPWMLAFVIRAVRTRGWRYPALFGITLALVSGINATAVIYVGLAPVLWLPFDVLVAREATGRQAWLVFVKVGLLSVLVSLWWIAGLFVEGAFGVNVLRYTESVQATSSTSNASEVIRGLGYWYFYGGDRMGLWTKAAAEFTQNLWLIALTYVVPVGAVISAAFVRWRYRTYFVAMVIIGLVLGVGAYPYSHPTAFGSLAKAFMTKTTAGLALRSTDRATPLIVLGLAMLMGTGVSAIATRWRRFGVGVFAFVAVLILAANAPFFAGRTVISQFSQPAKPPASVRAAAAHLNSVRRNTRVYVLPGNNFAAYRWGDTIDPVWPALLNRPFVTREQQIQGSLPTADLLFALDGPLQENVMNWNALAPIARLMSVGDVVVEYNQQYERYDTPRPAILQQQLAKTPAGLTHPIAFGPPTANRSSIPMYDETYYALPTGVRNPSPIVTYTVKHPRPIVRGESLAHPLVVDGAGIGLVDAADVGLLGKNPTVLYAGTLDKNKALAASILKRPADLVITDSNRKRAFEWNSLNDNTGYTETAGGKPNAFVQNDPGINLFPGTGPGAQTTTVLDGIASVTASAYGTASTLRSEWRPANAIDGNPKTAWETEGASGVPNRAWWQVTLDHPTTTGQVTLLQPQPVINEEAYTNQWITQATLTFDGKHPVVVDLGPGSRQIPGQVVHFPSRTFKTLRIRIDQTNLSTGTSVPAGSSLVGLAEVGIGHTKVTQVIKMPTDLLRQAGRAASTDRLTYLFSRDRVAPVPPRQSPEVRMIRQFVVPSTRSFQLVGTARISTKVPDPTVDQLVGRTGGGSPVVSATSSSRMPGDLQATASATLDHNPSTAWSPGIGLRAQQGSWLDYTFNRTETVDHLNLQVVSDAEHSRPTSITVSGASGSEQVSLPPIPVTAPAGSTTTVPVSFPAVTGTNIRVTFDTIEARYSNSYETSLREVMPIAIAEIGIPGVSGPPLPARIPNSCRSNLLSIDGRPVWLSISGSTANALLGQQGLSVSLCGPDSGGITLGTGTHLLKAANGSVTGFNLDQLALDSPATTGPSRSSPAADLAGSNMLTSAPGAASGAPVVRVIPNGATAMTARVSHATRPFLFVLGQSINRGWSATVPGVGSLGAPTLVDGFANGWKITRADLARASHGGAFTVDLRFTPQQGVNIALVISGATVLACLLMVIVALSRRRRRHRRTDGPSAVPAPPAFVSFRVGREGFQRSRPTAIVIATVLAGGSAWAFGGPFAGTVTALGALAATTVPWGRMALRVGAVGLMAAGALDVVAHQARYRYPPGGWPTNFDRASTLIWGGVMLIGAEAALCFVRRYRSGRKHVVGDDDHPPQAQSGARQLSGRPVPPA
ncbi:MAG: alpha-(1-_3)-arabinofuranosyltransferase domain-containing protein [Acidimicrobiales bacterium]